MKRLMRVTSILAIAIGCLSVTTGLVATLSLPLAASASASERFVYEAFPAPGSEVEETGNLYVMEEGSEPEPLEVWGRNPSLDPSGRLIAYYEEGLVYVTDIEAHTTRIVDGIFLGEEEFAASPQWVPGHGLLIDGTGDIRFIDCAEPNGLLFAHKIIAWPGKQWAPAASPSGEKVAFLSETNPKGEALEGGPAVFVTNLDGTEPVQITNPEEVAPVGAPTFSPDGTHLAFSGFGEFNEWEQGDLVTVSVGGGSLTPITNISEGIAWEPDWLYDGTIAFTEEHWGSGTMEFLKVAGEGGEVTELHAPFTEGEFGWHIAGRQPDQVNPLTSESEEKVLRLLYLNAPTLKYDSTETFRATQIQSILETYSGTKPEDSNKLVNAESEVIQYANPTLNPFKQKIWLAAQGEEYFTDPLISADESDRLDEHGESYAEDAAPWQEEEYFGDTIYGRAVYAEGHWWLQYWFWYYYDEFNLFGVGDHEGDWEMIQLQLDEYGHPQSATYAQHHDSEADTCNFNILDWTIGRVENLSPVVYVATGTHASYIRPGLAVGSFPYDRADGEGYVARPRVVNMLNPVGEYERNWNVWPGRWGNSLGSGESPMAPISQGEKWDGPGAFAEQAESCPREEEGTPQALLRSAGSRHRLSPQPPVVRANLKAHRVIVNYQMHQSPAGEKQGIEVAVLASNKFVTPTKKTATRDRGRLSLPLPNSAGPYTVVARAVSENGAGSPKVSVQIGSRDNSARDPSLSSESIGAKADSVRAEARLDSQLAGRLKGRAAKALRRRARRVRAMRRRLRNAHPPIVTRIPGEKKDGQGVLAKSSRKQ
jgi:hypothetical protein